MTASAADSGNAETGSIPRTDGGFQCTDGTYPKNGLYEVDGTAYAFDANGYMVTGWHFLSDYWFYFKDSGAMQTDGSGTRHPMPGTTWIHNMDICTATEYATSTEHVTPLLQAADGNRMVL